MNLKVIALFPLLMLVSGRSGAQSISQYPPAVQLTAEQDHQGMKAVSPPTAARPSPLSSKMDDGSGAYRSDRYRNLFAEQGHTPAQIDTKIDAAFQQLFHGDKSSQAIYYEVGSNQNGPLAYITDIANHDARTEGMSYGMMIAVQMNKKREFDAIWNWANTYMLITDPGNPSVGYFAWSMNVDGTPRSDSPAPDGEEYFVMSLYFAAHRWGSGNGLYDYKAQADRILSLMRHHPRYHRHRALPASTHCSSFHSGSPPQPTCCRRQHAVVLERCRPTLEHHCRRTLQSTQCRAHGQ